MQVAREEPLSERVYRTGLRRLLTSGAILGVVIFVGLLPAFWLSPRISLQLLWFLFIPLAPMFLLAAPNAWVSLCPVSSLQTMARHFGWKGAARLSPAHTRRLQLVGWVLMFLGIPSRHVVFNTNGPALFAAAGAVTLLVLGIGFVSLALSGWCMGACPIRPVEVIYGQFALDKNRPVKCGGCDACVSSCVRLQPENGGKELGLSKLTSILAQAFPGFVASYFLLDLTGLCNAERAFFRGDVPAPASLFTHAALVYAVMALGALFSFLVFHALGRVGVTSATRFKAVAIAAYCCYYLGVAPEIAMAWSLPPNAAWALICLPALVLTCVLCAPRWRVAVTS
jgi:hypothetical protein